MAFKCNHTTEVVYKSSNILSTIIETVKSFFYKILGEKKYILTSANGVPIIVPFAKENEHLISYINETQTPISNFIENWGKELNEKNEANFIKNYCPDASLWGTLNKKIYNGHHEIQSYFKDLMKLKDIKVNFSDKYEIRHYSEVSIQSGTYELSFCQDENTITIPIRYSFVCKYNNNQWCIVEQHTSQLLN